MVARTTARVIVATALVRMIWRNSGASPGNRRHWQSALLKTFREGNFMADPQGGPDNTSGAIPSTPAKRTPVRKDAARKAPTVPAKKAPIKRVPAKKVPAKKAGSKKAPAKAATESAQRAAPAAQLQARRWFNVHEYQVG